MADLNWENLTSTFTDEERRINNQVWQWTVKKISYGADFPRWTPAEHQIVALALQLGLSREQADKNRMLLKICVMDRLFCDACKSGEKLKCHMQGRPTRFVESQRYIGEFELGSGEPCDRYLR